jgi:hypothetical protein
MREPSLLLKARQPASDHRNVSPHSIFHNVATVFRDENNPLSRIPFVMRDPLIFAGGVDEPDLGIL